VRVGEGVVVGGEIGEGVAVGARVGVGGGGDGALQATSQSAAKTTIENDLLNEWIMSCSAPLFRMTRIIPQPDRKGKLALDNLRRQAIIYLLPGAFSFRHELGEEWKESTDRTNERMEWIWRILDNVRFIH
jgi:hypothetical protein